MGAAQSQPQEEEEETPAPAPATPRPESPVPPLAEHPTAFLIGDGASCMTRDRGEILALHGQGRCFGRVRGVGGAEAELPGGDEGAHGGALFGGREGQVEDEERDDEEEEQWYDVVVEAFET